MRKNDIFTFYMTHHTMAAEVIIPDTQSHHMKVCFGGGCFVQADFRPYSQAELDRLRAWLPESGDLWLRCKYHGEWDLCFTATGLIAEIDDDECKTMNVVLNEEQRDQVRARILTWAPSE